MKKALAVIGSGMGDEGKGLMTDHLSAARSVATVVRTNGGAQAGHTVQTPDGRRHVFRHFGSGTLAGASTHLSQFFVSHPLFFIREHRALRELGAAPRVTVDPRGIITLPYDMMINQAVERRRGGARHGSCGMGFGEAIERSLAEELRVTVGDLVRGGSYLRAKLDAVRLEWAPARMTALGFEGLPDTEATLFASEPLADRFVADCAEFWDRVVPLPDSGLVGRVLFEGAQGLLLDQDSSFFPHVTRSHTGLRNMLAVAEEAGYDHIDAVYMTRAYATRHGAGPLGHAGAVTPWLTMRDPTNVTNDWQGSIRTAPLDVDLISDAVRRDLSLARSVSVSAAWGVSCLDQVGPDMAVVLDRSLVAVPRSGLGDVLYSRSGISVGKTSHGPTRHDVSDVAPTTMAA